KELEEDIAELKRLSLDAERINVQTILAQQISKLKTKLDQLIMIKQTEAPKKQDPPPAQTAPKTEDKLSYQSLTKYAWDQEGSKVKYFRF
ncbi:MAG: hypothetical protein KDD45_06040, partial [Bdellovibrionales bacterium]|nr:hypothetical protein [Bdellovibrionales bacterium]